MTEMAEFFKLSYYSHRGGKKLHQICSATCIYRTVFELKNILASNIWILKGKRIIKNYFWIFAYMMFSETTAAPHWTTIVSKCSRKLTVNKWTSGGKWTSMKYKPNAQELTSKASQQEVRNLLRPNGICIRYHLSIFQQLLHQMGT